MVLVVACAFPKVHYGESEKNPTCRRFCADGKPDLSFLLIGKARRTTPPNKDFLSKPPTMAASRGMAKQVTQQMLFGAAQHHPVIVFERWLYKKRCRVFRW